MSENDSDLRLLSEKELLYIIASSQKLMAKEIHELRNEYKNNREKDLERLALQREADLKDLAEKRERDKAEFLQQRESDKTKVDEVEKKVNRLTVRLGAFATILILASEFIARRFFGS